MIKLKRLDLSSVHVGAVGMGALLSIAQPDLAPFVVGIIALAYLLALLVFKKRITRTPANLSLGLLAGVCLLNPVISVRPSVSLPLAMQMIVGISLLLSISGWARGPATMRLAMFGLAVIGILLVAVAPFTVDWITDKVGILPGSLYTWLLPLSRKVIHPNILAGAAAVLFVTLIGFQRFSWPILQNRERLFFALVSSCLVLLLVISQSRGAMMGVLFGLGSMWALSLGVRNKMLLVAAVLAGSAVLVFANMDLSFLIDSSASIRGASGRLEIWTHATELIGDFPFTGIGFGNFRAVTGLLYPFLVAGYDQSHAHNFLLQIAVDMGLTGLIIWLSSLLLVLGSCVRGWRLARTSGDLLLRGMSAGLLCGLLTMLAHGLTDAPLWATRPGMIVWGLWGLALALPAAGARMMGSHESESSFRSAHERP